MDFLIAFITSAATLAKSEIRSEFQTAYACVVKGLFFMVTLTAVFLGGVGLVLYGVFLVLAASLSTHVVVFLIGGALLAFAGLTMLVVGWGGGRRG